MLLKMIENLPPDMLMKAIKPIFAKMPPMKITSQNPDVDGVTIGDKFFTFSQIQTMFDNGIENEIENVLKPKKKVLNREAD